MIAKIATILETAACFVAGTLVHTKDGLKPIEQIQVGDLVLSKPEDGTGEKSYQPVTRTISYENRELFWLRWQLQIDQPGEPKWEHGEVAVTGAHPIWVTRLSRSEGARSEKHPDGYSYTEVNDWMSVGELYLRMWKKWHTRSKKGITLVYAQVADGRSATIGFIEPLLQCLSDPQWDHRLEVPVKDAAVTFRDSEEALREDLWGYTICFGPQGAFQSKQMPTSSMGNREDLEDLEIGHYTGYDTKSPMSVVKRSGGYLPTRRTVYNIEVANTHSYFVGELGLWAHDAQ